MTGNGSSSAVRISSQYVVDTRFVATRLRLVNLLHEGTITRASEDAFAAGIVALSQAWAGDLPAVTLTGVRLMEPRAVGRAVLLPLPVLNGDLIMTEARARNTVLKLDGAFRLPFPAASPATDRAAVRLPQLAAMASTETFMTRIADRLASATRAARNNNQ
jgi:hypothetical protein